MPIYEYRCRDCQDEFEVIQRSADRVLRTCKKCGGRLEKLLSKTSFVLKGSGWYADGYSGPGGKPAAKKGAKKTEKKTEKTSSSGGSKKGGD